MTTKHEEKLRAILKNMFSLKEDTASHEEIRDRLLSGGKITGTNMCVLICAMVIASVGLNFSSTAVIIGAMLISPLMGSILAMAFGIVSNEFWLFRNHGIGLVMQILISLAASTLYFLISPVKEPTAELLARTSPGWSDVIIATAGGIAGIIGQTRKGIFNNIIPGVAIATALMPPLCTCGYAIANGRWDMLLGAGYLFTINAYFIMMSSAVILSLLKIPREHGSTEQEWKKKRSRMIRNTLILFLPAVIILIITIVQNVGKYSA